MGQEQRRSRGGDASTASLTISTSCDEGRIDPALIGSAERAADDLGLVLGRLGHVNPAQTYWYLQTTPELMALVAERLERSWQDRR